MQSVYESQVDPLRPNDAHGISLQLVGRSKKVLELGAASGHVTRALKQQGNSVVAVERDGRFSTQLEQIADAVYITDLDWLDLRELLCDEKFDVILAGDVLEHCSRPELVLLQMHDLLVENGYLVISLPNIAHADVRLSLLKGNFEYSDVGLLDRTHLRFFTRETIQSFLDKNGFETLEIFGSTANIGATEFGPPSPDIPLEAIRFVQQDRDALVYQYVLKARVKSAGFSLRKLTAHGKYSEKSREQLLAEVSMLDEYIARISPVSSQELADTQQELADTQQELADTQQQLATSRAEAFQLRNQLVETRVSLLEARDHAIGSSAELGEARYRLDIAQAQIDSLVDQLNLLHSSRTWRAGRIVLLPLRLIRRILTILIN